MLRKYNLPHGYSVAITLGKFWINKQQITQLFKIKGSKYIRRNMKNLYKLMDLILQNL